MAEGLPGLIQPGSKAGGMLAWFGQLESWHFSFSLKGSKVRYEVVPADKAVLISVSARAAAWLVCCLSCTWSLEMYPYSPPSWRLMLLLLLYVCIVCVSDSHEDRTKNPPKHPFLTKFVMWTATRPTSLLFFRVPNSSYTKSGRRKVQGKMAIGQSFFVVRLISGLHDLLVAFV